MDFDFLEEDDFTIDPLLSSRRPPTDTEIDEILDRFVEGELSSLEADAAFERLARAQGPTLARLLEMAASPDPDLYQVAAALLPEMDLSPAIGPLRRLLEDQSIDDDHKMSILHALWLLGGIGPGADPFVHLSDPEAMIRDSQQAFLDLLQDPSQLEIVLRAELEGGLPTLVRAEALAAVASTGDRRMRPLFLCLLHADDSDVVTGAIEALEVFQDPATVPILEERARHDPVPSVRRAARQAADALSSEMVLRPPSILELPVAPPPLARCLISTIDGNGGQILLVIRQAPDHPPVFCDVMFNDHEGIKDCYGGQADSVDEIGLAIVDGMAEIGIEMVDIGVDRALTELQRAYHTTLEAKRRLPFTFMAWQAWLEGEDPYVVTSFTLPGISAQERTDLLAKCDDLLDLEEFTSWVFDPEELKGLERRFRKLLHGEGTDDAVEALVTQGIRRIVDGPRRQMLKDRLLRQSWLLAQVYEDREVPKLALAAATGLGDDCDAPLVDHPLLRGMILRSFANAVQPFF
jgi:HEAT repeat protein